MEQWAALERIRFVAKDESDAAAGMQKAAPSVVQEAPGEGSRPAVEGEQGQVG